MEENLENALPIPEIGRRAGLSQRQIDRLLAAHMGKSPILHHRDIRLDRARGFVTQTAPPILEVALASGFASPKHFSRACKARFGLSPTRDRVEGRVPFECRAWPMRRAPAGVQSGQDGGKPR